MHCSPFGDNVVHLLAVLGAIGTSFIGAAIRPRAFRLTSTVHHLDRVGWQAIGIVLLITLLIGGIIAQQGIFHFRKVGDGQVIEARAFHADAPVKKLEAPAPRLRSMKPFRSSRGISSFGRYKFRDVGAPQF